MKLYEKIREIRKKKGISMVAFQKRLQEIFGQQALRYNTLYRIEKGLRDARISSLSQICVGLGVSLKELKEGTEEESVGIIKFVTKRGTLAQYVYSDKALAQILTKENYPFLGLRLILQPSGKTATEQDPVELGRFEKWVYGLRGKVSCIVGKNTYTIKKDEALCFESTIPHFFENRTAQKASCIIIQNPRHI